LYKQEKERYREEGEKAKGEDGPYCKVCLPYCLEAKFHVSLFIRFSNAKNIHLLDPPRPPAASHSRGTAPTHIHIPEGVWVPKAVNPADYAMEDRTTSAHREKEKEKTREKERKRRPEKREKDRRPRKDSYDRKQNALTDYDPRPIFSPVDIKPMPSVPGMGVAYVPIPIPFRLFRCATATATATTVPPTAAPTKGREGEKEGAKGKEKEKERPKEDEDNEQNWQLFMPKFLDHKAPSGIYSQRQRSMHLSEREE